MVSPQNTMDNYSTPSDSHNQHSDGYDTDLLARAPELTREQRQEGYDETLLNRGPSPMDSPANVRGVPLGAAAPIYPGGDHAPDVNGSSGGIDGRGMYTAVGEKGISTPNQYSNKDLESRQTPPLVTRKPWFKRPLILGILAAIIVIIVIAIAVPVAVTSGKSSNKSSSNSSSGLPSPSAVFPQTTPGDHTTTTTFPSQGTSTPGTAAPEVSPNLSRTTAASTTTGNEAQPIGGVTSITTLPLSSTGAALPQGGRNGGGRARKF